jgi:hypothetical protein
MPLVIFGLLVSIPIIVWGSQLVLKLMDRFPIIITAGGMLLGWIAGTLAVSDPAGLIVFIALLLGVGLWLRWQLRARERRPSHRLTRPSAHDSSAFVETTPLGDGPGSPARPLDDDQDDGPATVMSYMDVPTNTRPSPSFRRPTCPRCSRKTSSLTPAPRR